MEWRRLIMTKLEKLISKHFPQEAEYSLPVETIEDLSYYLEDERRPEELERAYFELLKFLHVINKEWE